MSTWHYLPVITGDGDETSFSLCEVYLNDDNTLSAWSTDSAMTPYGADVDDLVGTLILMLYAAHKWEPVRHSNLKVGMIFKRRDGMPDAPPPDEKES
jgi:hypothetical protein